MGSCIDRGIDGFDRVGDHFLGFYGHQKPHQEKKTSSRDSLNLLAILFIFLLLLCLFLHINLTKKDFDLNFDFITPRRI